MKYRSKNKTKTEPKTEIPLGSARPSGAEGGPTPSTRTGPPKLEAAAPVKDHATSPGMDSPGAAEVTPCAFVVTGPPLAVPVIVREEGTGKVTVTDHGLALIEQMSSDGHPQANIAKALRIDQVTLRQVRRRDPRVQEALDLGLAANERELVNLLMSAARDGQIVPAIFLLKAKHGFREGEHREAPVPNVVINLPAAMNPEQYRQQITILPTTEDDEQ